MAKKKRIRRKHSTSFYAVLPMVGLMFFMMIDFGRGNDVETASGGALLTLVRATLYLAAGTFLLKGFKRNLNWFGSRIELVLCLVFVLVSAAWANYPVRVMINFLHFLGGAIAAYAAARYFARYPDRVLPFLAVMFGTASVLSILAVFFLPTSGLQYFQWEEVYRWRGVTTNPNSLGLICLLTVWSNAGMILTTKNQKLRILGVGFIGVAIACLIGAESRTSQMMSVVSVVLSVLIYYVYTDTNAGRRKKLVFLTYFLIVISVVLVAFFADFFVPDNATHALGREKNLSGRTNLWQDAFILIKMHPLVGWGFDNHKAAYEVIFNEVPHYHNGYIDMLVAGGAIGLALFLAFIIRIFRDDFKALKITPGVFAPFLGLMVAFMIYNMTEVTIGAFANIFWMTALFSYFLAGQVLKRVRRKKRRRKFVDIPKRHRKKVIASV